MALDSGFLSAEGPGDSWQKVSYASGGQVSSRVVREDSDHMLGMDEQAIRGLLSYGWPERIQVFDQHSEALPQSNSVVMYLSARWLDRLIGAGIHKIW